MPVHQGHLITFHADDIGSVVVMMDDDPPVPTGGYGGWQAVPRARRRSLTQFQGVDPLAMDIPVLFDGYADRDGQELDISKLSRMASPQGDGEPPVIEISGLALPNLGPKKWVIANLTFGKNVIRGLNSSGVLVRLRQDAVVGIMQYVADDRTAFSKLPAAQPGGGSWPKHYQVRRGDTLPKISSKFYKTPKKWKKIAQANGIRDPKNLKVGRTLVIPKP